MELLHRGVPSVSQAGVMYLPPVLLSQGVIRHLMHAGRDYAVRLPGCLAADHEALRQEARLIAFAIGTRLHSDRCLGPDSDVASCSLLTNSGGLPDGDQPSLASTGGCPTGAIHCSPAPVAERELGHGCTRPSVTAEGTSWAEFGTLRLGIQHRCITTQLLLAPSCEISSWRHSGPAGSIVILAGLL